MTDAGNTPHEPEENRHSLRQERRDARRAERRSLWGGAPIGAIILVIVGIVLLAQNFGFEPMHNWWALFLLIPAAGALVAAVRNYRASGDRVTVDVIGSLIGAAIFAGLCAAFLFDFGWSMFWPILLIAIGGGILAREYWPRAD